MNVHWLFFDSCRLLLLATPKTEPEVEAKKPAPPKSAPTKLIADPIVEKGIRETLRKPTGKLTKADLAKVTSLYLGETKITDVGLKEVAKLQQFTFLSLWNRRGHTPFDEMDSLDYLEWKLQEEIRQEGESLPVTGDHQHAVLQNRVFFMSGLSLAYCNHRGFHK